MSGHREPALKFLPLLLYFCFIFIRPHEWFPDFAHFQVTRIFLILSFLCFIFGNKNKIWPAQFWLFCVFSVVIMFSLIFNGWAGGGISRGIDFVVTAVIPFLITANEIDSEEKLKKIYKVLLLAGVIMVTNAVSQMQSPDGIGWTGAHTIMERATYIGVFGDPNDLGMFLLVCIPITLMFLQDAKGFWSKNLYRAVLIFLFVGIYYTNSRGTLVGIMLLFTIMFWKKYGTGKAMLALLPALPAALFVMSKFRKIDSNEQSAEDRIYAWYDGFQMFMANPLFGVGKGNFVDEHGLTAHNSYILVLGETGFIGFVVWMSALFLTLLQVRPYNFAASRYVPVAFYSMIGFCCTAFFLSRSYSSIAFLLMGVAVAVRRISMDMNKSEVQAGNGEAFAFESTGKLYMVSLVGVPFAIVGLYVITRILL